MGGFGYISRNAREELLKKIASGEGKYLVTLVGISKETNKSVRGGYKLFKELDDKEIIDYAKASAKENEVQLSKIEVSLLKTESVREIQL